MQDSVSTQQFAHNYSVTTNRPTVAKDTARWAIEKAKEKEEGSYYASVTAMTFTAFMIEGVVDHIGQLFVDDWDKTANEKLVIRCKTVRKAIGLKNDTQDFQQTHEKLKLLVEFRHSFAHPKTLHSAGEEITDQDPTEARFKLPSNLDKLSTEESQEAFDFFVEQCKDLLNASADYIEALYKDNYIEACKRHPKLSDHEKHCFELRQYLNITETATGCSSLIIENSHD